jgi:hypothetical protein
MWMCLPVADPNTPITLLFHLLVILMTVMVPFGLKEDIIKSGALFAPYAVR